MTTPDISVVIIVRDQPEAHQIALHSLLNVPQCNEHWEIIVCDNGSNPRMVDSVNWDQYSKNVPISYIDCSKYKGLLGVSRNLGIEKAKSPIVMCLDGDIILPPMLVQKHLEKHQGAARIIGGSRKWRTIDIDVPAKLDICDSYNILLNSLESRDEKARRREEVEINYALNASENKNYMACLGFQLSFLKSKETYFSTNLKGWGFEDKEFILRQMKNGTHEIIYAPDCQVLHLDSEERSFNPFRDQSSSPELVTQFLMNMTSVVEQYKQSVDLDDLYYGLDRIQYNAQLDNWQILSSDLRDPASARIDKYNLAVNWLLKKGYVI